MRNLLTRKGVEVATPYTDGEAIKRLTMYVNSKEIQNSFAERLLSITGISDKQYSPDQLTWIHKLVIDYETKLEKPKEEVIRFPRIAELMNKAAENLKYPKIQITQALKLSRSQNGVIFVIDHNSTAGRIHPKDGLHKGNRFTDEILIALQKFETNPLDEARAFGIKFSFCCFCRRELTTEESVLAGYGPICADRFGLPWGQRVDPKIKRIAAMKRKLATLKEEISDDS